MSLASGKTKAEAVELLAGKQRPLQLVVKVLVKKAKETVATEHERPREGVERRRPWP